MSKELTALAAVIRDAREVFYRGTTNWGLPLDYFVAGRVLEYLERQSQEKRDQEANLQKRQEMEKQMGRWYATKEDHQ